MHGASLAFAPRSHSTGPSGGSIGFALLATHFSKRGKVSKNAALHPGLAALDFLTPSALRGRRTRAIHGPLSRDESSRGIHAARSLRTDSVRPPERGIRWGLIASSSTNKQRVLVPLFANFQAARTRLPFRRPSVGAAQGTRGMDAERAKGQGRPSRRPRAAPEGGSFVANRGALPDVGVAFFWLLFLARAALASKKSDAPCEAQPVVRAEESAARPNRPPKPTTVTSATSLTSDATARRTNQASGSPLRPHTMSLSPCA